MNANDGFWVMAIALIIILIIFLFSYGRQDYMYTSEYRRNTLKTYYMGSPTPVMVRDSGVLIVDECRQDDRENDDRPRTRISPMTVREGSVFDVPIVGGSTSNSPRFRFEVGYRQFKSIGEQLCCKVFEEYINENLSENEWRTAVVNKKYDFLRTEENPPLELDMFDPVTKIAIEYNGRQHYEYTTYYHSSNEQFKKQQRYDEIKLRKCEENGVHLIVVPHYVDSKVNERDPKRKYELREDRIRAYLTPILDSYFSA
jgi:hypothetical protein